MSNLVDLDAYRPHYAGLCSCLTCEHEWIGVVPTIATLLECGACGQHTGVMYSAREVRLLRALEAVATGSSGNAADLARSAIASENWPVTKKPTQ